MERDTHRCSHSGGERAAALSHDMHRLGDSRQVERSRDMSEKHRCPIAGDEASRRGEDGEPRRRHDAPCFSESPKQGHVWFPEAISGHDMCRESRRRMPLHCAGVRVGLLSLGIAAIAVLAMPVAGGARRHQGTLSSMIAASAASGPRPLGGQQLGDLAKSADAMDTGAAVVEVGDKKGGVAVHDRKLLEVEPAPRKQTTQGQAAQGISGGGSTMGRYRCDPPTTRSMSLHLAPAIQPPTLHNSPLPSLMRILRSQDKPQWERWAVQQARTCCRRVLQNTAGAARVPRCGWWKGRHAW